jgi:acyl-CoA synthetase (NDP forming)
MLDEAASLAIVSSAGLPTVLYRVCWSLAEAQAAYADCGPKVVMKACAAGIPHKSDHKLVILPIENEIGVKTAFLTLQARLASLGVSGGAVIVATMATGQREFMLGARVDPVFGPVLMVGDGGTYVEVFKDTAVLLAPVTGAEVHDALHTLRAAPLLSGVRGAPPLDIECLCAVAVQLGDLIAARDSQIASIDLNPVIVRERGQGVIIVDAVVETSVAMRLDTASLRA